MERVPEPELMLDSEQARQYAEADFAEPHDRFVALLRERLPELGECGSALDLGCGPGDVTFRLARALPGWSVDAVDGSDAMLTLARRALQSSGLGSRIRFHEALLPSESLPGSAYDLVFSNSLLHHLSDPAVLWSSVRRWGSADGHVFVMDLLRPQSPAEAASLVDLYTAGEPELLRSDFHHSLLAAYRPDELSAQLAGAGLGHLEVEVVSDRHLIVWGRIGR